MNDEQRERLREVVQYMRDQFDDLETPPTDAQCENLWYVIRKIVLEYNAERFDAGLVD